LEAKVSAILHGGDVSNLSVLDTLRQVAPVYAVEGNRDFMACTRLPMAIAFSAGEVIIGLTHGHGGMRRYIEDKIHFLFHGFDRGYYHSYLRRTFPEAQVIVYGHTHFTDVTWVDGCLYFNPGAAGPPTFPGLRASMGLLHIGPHREIKPELIDIHR
jgi:putative phosphoesterase